MPSVSHVEPQVPTGKSKRVIARSAISALLPKQKITSSQPLLCTPLDGARQNVNALLGCLTSSDSNVDGSSDMIIFPFVRHTQPAHDRGIAANPEGSHPSVHGIQYWGSHYGKGAQVDLDPLCLSTPPSHGRRWQNVGGAGASTKSSSASSVMTQSLSKRIKVPASILP